MASQEEQHIVLMALNPGMGSALITPLEILTHVSRVVPLKVTKVTLDGAPIVTRSGIRIDADGDLRSVSACDAVIVTSCIHHSMSADPLRDTVVPWLRAQWQQGAVLGALGSGVVMVAMSGLLDGLQATADWRGVAPLQRVFPNIRFTPQHPIRDQGGVVTSSGGHAGELLSLYMVERLFGRVVAQRCADDLMLDFHRVHAGEATDTLAARRHQDARIHLIQTWLEKHYMEDIRLEWLAERHHMSLRNFMRRFKEACGETPLGYIQRIRVEEAKRLLGHTALSVEVIAEQVGYQTESHFRRLFKRHTELTPAQYRDQSAGTR